MTTLYISIILQSIVNFLIEKTNDQEAIHQMVTATIANKTVAAPTSEDKQNSNYEQLAGGSVKKYKEFIQAGVALSGLKSIKMSEPKINSLNKFVNFTEKRAKEICKGGNGNHLSEMIRRSALFLNVKDSQIDENKNLMKYIADNECLPLSTNTYVDLFAASMLRIFEVSCKNTIDFMTKLDELTKIIGKRPNTVEELNMLIDLKMRISNMILYEVYPNLMLSYFKSRDKNLYMKLKEYISTRERIDELISSRCDIKSKDILKLIGGGSSNGLTSLVTDLSKNPIVKDTITTLAPSITKMITKPKSGKSLITAPLKISPTLFGLYNIIDGLLTVLINYSDSVKNINKKTK